MRLYYKFIFLIISYLMLSSVYADITLVKSDVYIVNLTSTLKKMQMKTTIPVVFPKQVLSVEGLNQLYASFDPALVNSNSYWINIDSTADCLGAHYCNIGNLKVAREGSPQIYDDINKRPLTKIINLTRTQTIYYTPGHAMGDFWPPTIEWCDQHYFYHFTWQVASEDALIQIAKSLYTHSISNASQDIK